MPKDHEIDWPLWRGVIVVGLAIWVALFLIHRYTQIGRSLSVDGLAMIGTTLIAAGGGFAAILYQVRSSSKQFRDQIKADREAEVIEQERQKRAVATALSAEIDDFYKFFLRRFWEERARIYPSAPIILMLPPLPELGPLPPTAFLVYKSTVGQLGILNGTTVKAVVGFYNYLANFVEHYESYRKTWSSSSTFADDRPATELRDICEITPSLILDCDRTCEQLAKELGVSYQPSRFAVARIHEANNEGKTVKDVLEAEVASIRNRINKRKAM